MTKLLFSVTINDCTVQTFRAGGSGGQHQNKTESGVRVIHKPSGAIGECREFRSQHQSKRMAFLRMAQTQKFKSWQKLEAARIMGRPSIDDRVEAMLAPENLKVEVRDEHGRWISEENDGS